jgi:hypothetical protein
VDQKRLTRLELFVRHPGLLLLMLPDMAVPEIPVRPEVPEAGVLGVLGVLEEILTLFRGGRRQL